MALEDNYINTNEKYTSLLLSGIQSAKFWYNENSEDFLGDGTDFENNRKFEDYGYYKVVVVNGVGLQKEVTFLLNKDSIKR